ncbi:MAG: serpin family protein [Oscillospiraceae bacterium]|nr:serpin family protein [Oscillospiraceae bacterium]
MKNRLIALLLLAALLTGLLAGCAPGAAEPLPTDAPTPQQEPESTPEPEQEVPMTPTTELPADTYLAIADFSQTLFRELLAGDEENPVISPLSAYFALAMVALGARGETWDEFEAVLGRNPAELAGDLAALTASLTDTGGSTVLNIANSVWVADEFTVDPSFAQVVRDHFDAPVESRDFQSPATVDEINAWVSERTEGLIEKLIDRLDPNDAMLLINTLYFQAKWAAAFNPMTEFTDTFHPATGDSVEVPFLLAETGNLALTVSDSYEAVMLPYDDGRLGFLLVRPTDGTDLRDFARTHDLSAIAAGLETHSGEVEVRMPRLDLEFEITMDDLLMNMGLMEAFVKWQADFSGLLTEEEPLFISQVLQKVRLMVDEEGTEAAAATAVGIRIASAPINLITLTFDSPYLYAIYDLETGLPLFIGLVDNPA